MRVTASTAGQVIAQILENEILRRKAKNPRYSARALARDAQVSPSLLNMVIKGHRGLSVELANRIGQHLDLPPPITRQLVKATALLRVKAKNNFSENIDEILADSGTQQEFVPVEVDRFTFFSHWYHVALLDLATCVDFKANVSWIAKRIGISRELTIDSLARLLRLGLLKKSNGTLVKTDRFISIPTKDTREAVRNFHRQMIERAGEALNDESAEAFSKRMISGITFAVNPAKIDEAKKRLATFKREMADLLCEGDATEVYQLNVHLFPLTKTSTEDK